MDIDKSIFDFEKNLTEAFNELLYLKIVDENENPNNNEDDTYMDSIPKLTILIPNEEERELINLDRGEDVESNPPTPKSIDSILPFSKEWLYITSNLDKNVHFMPSKASSDTRKIWRYAKIPPVAFPREIEERLIDWAYTYADIIIEDRQIKKITWTTKSNSKCSSTWSAFVRWIICSAIP